MNLVNDANYVDNDEMIIMTGAPWYDEILHLAVLVAHWHPECVLLVNFESDAKNIEALWNLAKEPDVVGDVSPNLLVVLQIFQLREIILKNLVL